VSRAQDRELVHWLTQKAYHHRTFAWDTDLEAKVMALTGPQIRAAMAKYIQYAKLTVVKAGDFARPGASSAPTSAR
jgi:zinc protease